MCGFVLNTSSTPGTVYLNNQYVLSCFTWNNYACWRIHKWWRSSQKVNHYSSNGGEWLQSTADDIRRYMITSKNKFIWFICDKAWMTQKYHLAHFWNNTHELYKKKYVNIATNDLYLYGLKYKYQNKLCWQSFLLWIWGATKQITYIAHFMRM